MGSAVSHAAAPPPPDAAPLPPPAPAGLAVVLPPPAPADLAVVVPPAAPEAGTTKKVDYRNLPCPIPYEEIQREAFMSLKPELFEGLRFDFTKSLNQKFSLSHSLFMGSMEVSQQQQQNGILKVPVGSYEFGTNFLDPKLVLIGRVSPDGRMNARVKCDLTDSLIVKINAVLVNQPDPSQGVSQGVFHFDYKGRDFRSQIQLGNNGLYGVNYIQSVTPNLSLGSEVFYSESNRSSGVGLVGRYSTDKMVATAHVVNAGTVGLSYVQKVSEKVSLASDFTYDHIYKEVTASFGYDYLLRQSRLRGKIDTNGCVSAFLEERLNMGASLLFSGLIDHWKKDYKFGFGLTID